MIPPCHLDAIFLDELRGLHASERDVGRVLPWLAWTTAQPELRSLLASARAQTRLNLARLDRIFDLLGLSPHGGRCPVLGGLLAEAWEWIRRHEVARVHDAGLVAEVRQIEHHQLHAYTLARTHARLLGRTEVEHLLRASLHEEVQASLRLDALGQRLAPMARLRSPPSRPRGSAGRGHFA